MIRLEAAGVILTNGVAFGFVSVLISTALLSISEASRRAREQAANEFKTTRIVSARTFADIFGLKELGDVIPETATKVHICTIQGCRDAD